MIRLSWPMAILLCAGAAAQQPALPPGTYRVGGGVSAPRVIEKQNPEYSEEARITKMQGSVLLSLVVGTDGRAQDLRVIKSLGLGLDEMAVAAVSRWHFEPGKKDGQAVPVAATVETNFRLLLDKRSWYLARGHFSVPQGATPPRPIEAGYPAASGPEENVLVRLMLDVDEQGIPGNVRVETSTGSQWDQEVTTLVRNWRFQAAMKDGSPVAAQATLEFGRGDVEGSGAAVGRRQ